MKDLHDTDIQQSLQALQRVALSRAEKNALRARLSAHLAPQPRAHLPSPLGYFFVRTAPFVAVLLIVVVTTSTVAASEGALPGDVLYPIKVNLTEEVRALTRTSSQERAEWALERAERRIMEIEALAFEDKLPEATREEITEKISTHIAVAEAAAIEDGRFEIRARIEEEAHAVRLSQNRLARPALALASRELRTETARTEPREAPPEMALMAQFASEPTLAPQMKSSAEPAMMALEVGMASTEPALKEQTRKGDDDEGNTDTEARIGGAQRALERRIALAQEAIARREAQGTDMHKATEYLEEAFALKEKATQLFEAHKYRDALRTYKDAIDAALDALDAARTQSVKEADDEPEAEENRTTESILPAPVDTPLDTVREADIHLR